MIKKLRVTVDGVSYDVIVELFDEGGASAGGAAAPAEQAPSAVLSAPPLASTPAAIAAPASVAPAPAPAPAAAAGPGDVPSPLSGRVTAVVVAPGQTVKEGDHLLTLEAMKMNTFVFAPRGGKVAELRVAVGDVVEENQVLVKIH
jgi:glutaconyl-CoA/methylmalonyl-CoA decarboxylase subunit gamma